MIDQNEFHHQLNVLIISYLYVVSLLHDELASSIVSLLSFLFDFSKVPIHLPCVVLPFEQNSFHSNEHVCSLVVPFDHHGVVPGFCLNAFLPIGSVSLFVVPFDHHEIVPGFCLNAFLPIGHEHSLDVPFYHSEFVGDYLFVCLLLPIWYSASLLILFLKYNTNYNLFCVICLN